MDAWRRIGGAALLLTVAALVPSGKGGTTNLETSVRPTQEQQALVDWAVERYDRAELRLPAFRVEFHADPTGCRGNSGYYEGGHLDICAWDHPKGYARKVVVHELAHAWSEANLSAETREAFMALRGLPTWNSHDEAWGMRGFEQAAEVITWGVMRGDVTPLVGESDAPEALGVAYGLLTGADPPAAV